MGATSSILASSSSSMTYYQRIGQYLQNDDKFAKYWPLLEQEAEKNKEMIGEIKTFEDAVCFVERFAVTDPTEREALASLLVMGIKGDLQMSSCSLLGLSVAQLKLFAVEMVDKYAADMTKLMMKDVHRKLIEPEILGQGEPALSYCEFMAMKSAKSMNPSVALISYSPNTAFSEFVTALTDHFGTTSDQSLWIDIFSLPTTSFGAENDKERANSMLGQVEYASSCIGRTVVVLEPWYKRLALDDMFCLWVISLSRPNSVEVAMTPMQRSDLLERFKSDHQHVTNRLTLVDIDNALCESQSLRKTIVDRIKNVTQSSNTLNNNLFKLLRDSLISFVSMEIRVDEDMLSQARLKQSLAHLFQYEAVYDKAEDLYRSSLEEFRSRLGMHNAETLTAIYDLALNQKNCGNLEEAINLFRECMDFRITMLGPDHPDTIHVMNALSVVYSVSKRFAEAEPICRQMWETLKLSYGPDAPETLVALNNIGNVLKSLGKLKQAEAVFKECWRLRKLVLGENSIDTLITMSLVGSVCMKLNHVKEAEELLSVCTSKLADVAGPTHPRTIKCEQHLDGLRKKRAAKSSKRGHTTKVDKSDDMESNDSRVESVAPESK